MSRSGRQYKLELRCASVCECVRFQYAYLEARDPAARKHEAVVPRMIVGSGPLEDVLHCPLRDICGSGDYHIPGRRCIGCVPVTVAS